MRHSVRTRGYQAPQRTQSRFAPFTNACLKSKYTIQAVPERAAAPLTQSEDPVTPEVAAAEKQQDPRADGSNTTRQRNSQAAYMRKLTQDAYAAGFQAGYQKGIQVQVNVSLELDGTAGSSDKQQEQQSLANTSSSLGPRTQSDALTSAAVPSSPVPTQGSPDSLARSAVKGLVWRVFSTTATVSVAFLVFHDSIQASDALKFGGIEFATKYVLYFLHERLWAAVAVLQI